MYLENSSTLLFCDYAAATPASRQITMVLSTIATGRDTVTGPSNFKIPPGGVDQPNTGRLPCGSESHPRRYYFLAR